MTPHNGRLLESLFRDGSSNKRPSSGVIPREASLTHREDRVPNETVSADVRALVVRAVDGDAAAFSLIYREYSAVVYGICLRFAGHDVAWAERLTQDAFVRIWQTLHQFKGDGPLAAWLRRVATTHSINALRSRRRRSERELLYEELPDTAVAASQASPDDRFDLESAVAALPTGARTIFLLHDVHAYSDREIAQMLNTAPGTVRSQLHRARRLLRERMDR